MKSLTNKEKAGQCWFRDIPNSVYVPLSFSCVKQQQLDRSQPLHIIFIDADKTWLYKYINDILISSNLLQKNIMMIVDNILWKGLILDVTNTNLFGQPAQNNDTTTVEIYKDDMRFWRFPYFVWLFFGTVLPLLFDWQV